MAMRDPVRHIALLLPVVLPATGVSMVLIALLYPFSRVAAQWVVERTLDLYEWSGL